MTDQFDYEAFKKAAIKGLYEGKPLTDENGLFAPIAPISMVYASGAEEVADLVLCPLEKRSDLSTQPLTD